MCLLKLIKNLNYNDNNFKSISNFKMFNLASTKVVPSYYPFQKSAKFPTKSAATTTINPIFSV